MSRRHLAKEHLSLVAWLVRSSGLTMSNQGTRMLHHEASQDCEDSLSTHHSGNMILTRSVNVTNKSGGWGTRREITGPKLGLHIICLEVKVHISQWINIYRGTTSMFYYKSFDCPFLWRGSLSPSPVRLTEMWFKAGSGSNKELIVGQNLYDIGGLTITQRE